jgi:NAD(P)-dependent dehydrogenase (short-subunit alcohol dehydrogenase family)
MLTATAALYNLPEPEDLAHHQLLRRLVEAGEVAKVIAFCCSEGGAALNGSVIDASGGFKG